MVLSKRSGAVRLLAVGAAVTATSTMAFITAASVPGSAAPRPAVVARDSLDIDEVQPPDEAMATDLAAISDNWNLSIEEARIVVDAQQDVDGITFDSLDPGYVAIETTPGDPVQVDYYSTESEVGPVLDALDRAGIEDDVTTHIVPYSLDELRSAQQAIKREYPDLKAATTADYVHGAVGVEVTELPSVVTKRSISSIAGVPVRWQVVDQLSSPALGGGLPFGSCTGGFVVEKDGTSNRGLATAGHCQDTASYDGHNLNFKGERYRDRYDIQWMDNPNVNWLPRFRWQNGQSPRQVLGRMVYGNMDIGDPICKYGKVTGYTCGDISDTTYCPSYVTSCDSYFIVASNPSQDLVAGGDSGGPVFLGNTAIGFVSGEQGPSGSSLPNLIFMPQQFVNFFALHVAVAS